MSCQCAWTESCESCRPRMRIKKKSAREYARGVTFKVPDMGIVLKDRWRAMAAPWRPGAHP